MKWEKEESEERKTNNKLKHVRSNTFHCRKENTYTFFRLFYFVSFPLNLC